MKAISVMAYTQQKPQLSFFKKIILGIKATANFITMLFVLTKKVFML